MIGKDYLEDVINEEFGKVIDLYIPLESDGECFVNELFDLRNKIFERVGISE